MDIRTLVTGASGGASSAAGGLQVEKWHMAGRCTLINCLIFLIMTLSLYALEPKSLAVIQSAPVVFFAGSLFTFALMIQSGAVLAPVAWFVLGSGIYFGLGCVAGGLHVHMYSDKVFGADNLYLARVNLLNACSVLIVVGTALLFSRITEAARRANQGVTSERDGVLQKFFPYVLVAAVACIGAKFVMFPIAEDLLLRSILGKIYLLIPTCLLLLGMLWQRISRPLKVIALTVLFLQVLNGLVAFNKYEIMLAMLALSVGIWMNHKSLRAIFLNMLGLVLLFSIINPLISLGRSHVAYDPQKNTLETRIEILRDICAAYWNSQERLSAKGTRISVSTVNLKEMSKPEERLRAIGRRIEVASIQGYLINEYNNNHPGNTLSNAWMTFIPRAFWPQKPVMTQLGGELHKKYFNAPDQVGSSLAPTYSGEAYWNYGPMGVVLVSVLLGLAIGWLTHYSFLAIFGVRPEYFLIAVSVAIWACFVESWLVSSYLGEFVIFVLILLIARILMKCHDYLKNKKA